MPLKAAFRCLGRTLRPTQGLGLGHKSMDNRNLLLALAQDHLCAKLEFQGPVPLEHVVQPHFNRVGMVIGDSGEKFVIRMAKPNLRQSSDAKVSNELERVGFFELGGSYTLRSPADQQVFHDECIDSGLSVPAIVFATDSGCIVEFVDGTNVSVVLGQPGGADLMRLLLADLHQAHRLAFVLGDRHCCNSIRDRQGRIWHIDFDIKMEGPEAQTFEIVQAIFYSLHSARQKKECTEEAMVFLRETIDFYNLPAARFFLEKFCDYKGGYADGKYRATVPYAESLGEALA